MTTADTMPELDVRQIVIRGYALRRRTLRQNDTALKLRRDTDAQVVIDVFLPHGAHDVEFRFPPQEGTIITGRRVMRVARITMSGYSIDLLMQQISDGQARPQNWTVQEAIRHFSPVISGLYFTY